MVGRIENKKSININWWIGLLLSFGCCALLATLMSFKTMPISEGWYSEYAWLINNGQLPYRDFEYLFFPLYMFIIAGFTNIFGYSILALRILGILVFGGIGAALYCTLSKLFNNLSALVATFISTLFLQSEVGQLFYDYIRFHDLFTFIATYFMVKTTIDCYKNADLSGKRITMFSSIFAHYVVPITLVGVGGIGLIVNPISEHPGSGLGLLLFLCAGILILIINIATKKTTITALSASSIPASAVFCGLFAAMECLVKQSNGTLMLVMLFAFMLYCALVLKNKQFVKAFAGVAAGAVFAFLLLLIYLLATDTLTDFWRCCFGTALNAKGGPVKALFGWIWPNLKSAATNNAILIVALAIYAAYVLYNKNSSTPKISIGIKWLLPLGVILGAVTWLFVNNLEFANYYNGRNDTYIPGLVFFPCMLLFFVMAFYLLWTWIRGKKPEGLGAELFPVFAMLGAIFAQGYGSGMSGGLATSQTAMAMALIVAFCTHAALRAKAKVMMAWLLVSTITLSATFISRKTVQYYDWWGLTQGSLAEHTEYAEVPMLNGIQMRSMDKVCYETVCNDVVNNTEEGDSIFVFPHAPVFYTMTDRHSLTYSKVQWFDVSSAASISNDIQVLKNTPPKAIVYVTVPDWVYEGHESAFSTYQTRQMKDFLLNELIPQQGYTLLNQVDIGNGFFVSTYLLP